MQLKKIFKKICIITALAAGVSSVFYVSYSTSNSLNNKQVSIFKNTENKKKQAHELSNKHVIVFNKPSINSNKIITLYDHLQLETIIPFYETDDWIKVGNIADGKVGWVNKKQLDRFYNHLKDNKTIERYYEGEPKTSIKQSPNGKYIIKETNGIQNGVRYRITEEKFILDDSNPITIKEHENKPLYPHDISEQELQRALDELEYIDQFNNNKL